MKKTLYLTILTLLIFNTKHAISQEWKNIRTYKKATGNGILVNGSWLKKDRKNNTITWQEANKYNLSVDQGNTKYNSISQTRDFYIWFDQKRKKLGHEINGVGVAAIVAGQLSYFDNFFIRTFIVRNKEVVWFGNQGSKKVLEFAFPLLRKIYFSKHILKNQDAVNWDIKNGKKEQCQIVEAIYNQLSNKAIHKLERMAKGKGLYNLGVKNRLKFEGDIRDCTLRYKHAFTKLYKYYLDREKDN